MVAQGGTGVIVAGQAALGEYGDNLVGEGVDPSEMTRKLKRR